MAFLDVSFRLIDLRGIVGAPPGAVATPHASVGMMYYHTVTVNCIGACRAPLGTGRLLTVIAGKREADDSQTEAVRPHSR